MISTDVRRENVQEDILFLKKESPSQLKSIVSEGLASYAKAVKAFGVSSNAAKEALKTIREMVRIKKIEGRLFDYLLANIDSFDLSALENVAFKLDKLNGDTFESYKAVLGEINKACETKDSERKLRPDEGISSLLTNKRYLTMVLGLSETLSDIKEFLPYEDEFWLFIKDYLRVVPTIGEGARVMCGIVPIKDDDGNLHNFYTIVPKVVDYDTAMVAIEVYKRAHDLFLSLGLKYDDILKTNASAIQADYREHLEEKAVKAFR